MTTGFAFSYIERCIKENLASRKFGKKEMEAVINQLCSGHPRCIYCGSPDVGRWDHLYPVARGGDTVLGNMVPACNRCDDSKQDHAYAEWMLSDARFSPKSRAVADLEDRLRQIEAYVASHSYTPRPIEERLAPGELARLDFIRKKASSLRAELESLIHDVRARTGEN